MFLSIWPSAGVKVASYKATATAVDSRILFQIDTVLQSCMCSVHSFGGRSFLLFWCVVVFMCSFAASHAYFYFTLFTSVAVGPV
jgi:hypothetical protein